MKKLSGESLSISNENIRVLSKIFPEAVVEGEVNFDILRQLLGDSVVVEQERYSFTWNGKSDALRLSQTPSLETLRPCKEESKNWDTTQNIYIEGDNLEVLKLLQKSYYGKVKMIYIDPPYNTGNDLVYRDNFKDSIDNYKHVTGQIDGNGRNIATSIESNGRFHTNWLNMIYPRLRLARNLLTDDGVIFISIDDNEQQNLKKVCDEIFGENNFVAQICVKRSGGRQDSKFFEIVYEYLICYVRDIQKFTAGEEVKTGENYPKFDTKCGRNYKTQLLRKWGANSRRVDRPNLFYPIPAPDGSELYPMISKNEDGCWRWGRDKMQQALADGLIDFVKKGDEWTAYEKIYQPFDGEEDTKKFTTWLDESFTGGDAVKNLLGANVFPYPKAVGLINQVLRMGNVNEESIVLDFFSGSATTAHAVMQLNSEDGGSRRFIMVQLPELTVKNSEAAKAGYENICEIGKERIRCAGEKIKVEMNDKGQDFDIGFKVFKLDSSNFKKWNAQPEDIMQSLLESVDNFLPGRTELDVVYEILLKMGMELSTEIKEREVIGEKIYIVGGGALMICLGENITLSIADEMVKIHKEYNSELWQVVFHDTGFASDMDKTNIKETLKTAGLKEDNFVCI